jgi:flotillin
MELIITMIVVVLLFFFSILFVMTRYKRCPSDMVLVKYGRVGKDTPSACYHGGGTFIWPVLQDYAFLSLTPMTISIPLQNALSLQNIRINVPSTFTVGISTQPGIMQNAAERLLGLGQDTIEEMVREIIFGQLRLTVASLTIEQINQDRESFLESIRKNVEPELNKVGLNLINVNITDITDESDYIESIGKKAAAIAINQAKIDVAEQDKLGSIGEAQANREKVIRVAEAQAEADKGQKAAEADRRIFVQQQEAAAVIGEAEAEKERAIKVAQATAQAEKGRKQAEADRRIYVQDQEATAVTGENESKAKIAEVDALLAQKQAEATRAAEVARREAEAQIQIAQYNAEQERLKAEEIVKKEIEKSKIIIEANAAAEKARVEAKGDADATLMRYEAEAKGIRQVLDAKASGYKSLITSANGDAKAASTLLMVEKIDHLVEAQVEAIKNIKIDKITVWDSGSGDGKNGSSTSNFMSNLVRSIPPLQDVANMAGVELPEYLGKMVDEQKMPDA